MADITAIILTLNEEKNIEKCIRSIQPIVKRIVVVDSFSTDKTVEIAKSLGAEVWQHEFVNQAQQFIWAVDNVSIDTTWVFRIDADERLTEKSASELETLTIEYENDDVNDFIDIANKTKYSYFPVIDNKNKCLGIIKLSNVIILHFSV